MLSGESCCIFCFISWTSFWAFCIRLLFWRRLRCFWALLIAFCSFSMILVSESVGLACTFFLGLMTSLGLLSCSYSCLCCSMSSRYFWFSSSVKNGPPSSSRSSSSSEWRSGLCSLSSASLSFYSSWAFYLFNLIAFYLFDWFLLLISEAIVLHLRHDGTQDLLAPFLIKYYAISKWFCTAAVWNAVLPWKSTESKSAFCSTRIYAHSTELISAALCNGVPPSYVL